MEKLAEFFKALDNNYLESLAHFTTISERVGEIDNLFSEIANYIQDVDGPLKFLFFVRSHGAFRSSLRLAYSGQLVESYVVMRACLENAIYMQFLYFAPEMSPVWLDRELNLETKKQMRKSFVISRMLKEFIAKEKTVGTIANTLYDRVIDFGAHPNPNGVLTNVKIIKNEEVNDVADIRAFYFNSDRIMQRGALMDLVRISICVLKITQIIYKEKFVIMGWGNQIEKLQKGY